MKRFFLRGMERIISILKRFTMSERNRDRDKERQIQRQRERDGDKERER